MTDSILAGPYTAGISKYPRKPQSKYERPLHNVSSAEGRKPRPKVQAQGSGSFNCQCFDAADDGFRRVGFWGWGSGA